MMKRQQGGAQQDGTQSQSCRLPIDAAVADGVVPGNYALASRAVAAVRERRRGNRHLPVDIDGVTAVIYGELGFAPPLARGIFCLSRAGGIRSHAWEQSQRKERNKGPIPSTFDYAYTDVERRAVPLAARPRGRPCRRPCGTFIVAFTPFLLMGAVPPRPAH